MDDNQIKEMVFKYQRNELTQKQERELYNYSYDLYYPKINKEISGMDNYHREEVLQLYRLEIYKSLKKYTGANNSKFSSFLFSRIKWVKINYHRQLKTKNPNNTVNYDDLADYLYVENPYE